MSATNYFNNDEPDFDIASVSQVSQWRTSAVQQKDSEEQRILSGGTSIHIPDSHLLWSRVLFTRV